MGIVPVQFKRGYKDGYKERGQGSAYAKATAHMSGFRFRVSTCI